MSSPTNTSPCLFSHDEIRAGYQRQQQEHARLREIGPKAAWGELTNHATDPIFDAASRAEEQIHATADRHRLLLHVRTFEPDAGLTQHQTRIITNLICDELVRQENPNVLANASEGMQWAVTMVRENRANINVLVARVRDDPAIETFWENHAHTHGNEPLSRHARGYLLNLVRGAMAEEKGHGRGAGR